MATSRQIKEKIRDYRRSVKHSWLLFKESKIGMLGLAIMVLFVVVALISPYLGLRHPLNWWAPDEDVLRFVPFIVSDEGEEGVRIESGPVLKDFAVIHEDASPKRYYVAGGKQGSLTYRPGIYAYTPSHVTDKDTGNQEITLSISWSFPAGSNITTKVQVNDFGSRNHYIVFFGTEAGRFYLLDDKIGESNSLPGNEERTFVQLGDTVTGISYYEEIDDFFNYKDHFFVTANNTLYAYMGPLPVLDPDTGSYTYPFRLTEMWRYSVENATLSSPVTSKSGKYVFVGSSDGLLHGIDTLTGELISGWGEEPYRVSDVYWSGSPAVFTIPGRPNDPPYVFAATDDGVLHGIHSTNKTVLSGWSHFKGTELVNGFPLKNNLGELDKGNLTDIIINTASPGYILVGSSTGFYYSVNFQNVSQAVTFDTRISEAATTIDIAPTFSPYDGVDDSTKQVFVTVRNLNDTASDMSDDFSIIYCFNSTSRTTFQWRKIVDGVIMVRPIAHSNLANAAQNNLIWPSLFYNSTNPDEIVDYMWFSSPATGQAKGALPPTWATSDKPASGNYYWLGTDTQGHDILSQTILGSRIALLVGFLSAFFSIGIGVIVGLVSGYYGKGIDAVLMRFTDVILVLPGLPLLITLAAILNPSIWNIILVISIVGWGGVARVIRAEVLSLKERPFIDSARVTGASKFRIMFKHIAPNVLPLGLLYMTFAISGAILYEAALSFIGLGDPSTMTWGMMLNYVQQGGDALRNWWWLLPPGICITLVCMSFFLLGRAFDEIVNPRLRRRR